ncbi:MAG: ADP-ribosylglycohydrolase family protein [Deltaproteobacteria bacterium]|jgi:ADP-ribosylglycohydrolase|nr:ADP-ribosylglycohydrolase family protein [Deltaproteobacteria bacterium]MBW2518271.1 ADP-ribosylglycohydrolase family protein [Deltaproteobacteria bacterium]
MHTKPKAMVLASFAADSLALGVHWIYNTGVIDKKFGRVERFIKPERPTYHPTKDLGEFTHYGDQSLILLESVSECNRFDLSDFSDRWQKLFASYDGYVDGATKGTLENLAAGKSPSESGSGSDDLAGASRIAPLVYLYRNDLPALIAGARAQTAFTHNHGAVIESAAFFATIAFRILAGAAPTAAIEQTREEVQYSRTVREWIQAGLSSVAQNSRLAISDFGQMCEIPAAFPGVIHLIAKYETDLKTALVENAMAGGDSAGRGLLVGMVLGAYLGQDAIPPEWLHEMKARRRILDMLEKIDNGQDF